MKTTHIQVRVSVEEKAVLVARCARDGVSVSEYVRALIRENEERRVLPGGPARKSVPPWPLSSEAQIALSEKDRLAGLPSAAQVARRSFTPDFKNLPKTSK